MATILANVGWRTTVLEGGYKTYRRWVLRRLYDEALPHRLIVLDGGTGCGKTEILGRLASRGVQVVDLEGLAEHRGSLFGALGRGDQPGQKLFESRLASAFGQLDPSKPVVVEAESAKIGARVLPPSVWEAMVGAPRIVVNAPLEERAAYLAAVYSDITGDRAALDAAIAQLPLRASPARRAVWAEMAKSQKFVELAAAIIRQHYDPSYARSRKGTSSSVLGRIELSSLTIDAQERATDQIARLICAFGSDA